MKKFKKIAALLLAMVMALAMAVPAMAENGSATDATVATLSVSSSSSDRGSITVSGYKTGTPTAYKVVGAQYSTEGYFEKYVSLVDGLEVEVVENDDETVTLKLTYTVDGKVYTGDDAVAKLTAAIQDGDITPVSTTTLTSLEIGSYIIIIENTEDAVVYNPMMGSVYYNPSDNGTSIMGTTINVKYTDGPTGDKTVAAVDGVVINGGTRLATNVAVGSTLTFEITGYIPEYDLDAYTDLTYTFHDTLSTGLEYVTGSMEVTSPENVEIAAVGDSAVSGSTITIEMTDAEVRANVGKTIKIQYEVKVTKDALVDGNFDPTTNTLYVEYSNDSNTTDTTEPVVTYQYTFDIDDELTKVDTNGDALDGATFTLYTTDAEGKKSSAYAYPDGTTATCTTGTDGDIEFLGIPAGTYVIEETAAPDGYQLTGKSYTVTITPEYSEDGKTVTDVEITIVDENNTETDKVVNTTLSELPSTGGIGTTIFTVVGCMIMIAAGGMLIVSRRRKNA